LLKSTLLLSFHSCRLWYSK